MTTIKCVSLRILCAISSTTPISAQQRAVPQQNPIIYLKQFRSEYCQSRLDAKFEGLQHYYAEDIRLMPEFQKTVMGKPNTLTYDIAFSQRFEIKQYKREEAEIIDLGTRVVETGNFEMKILVKKTDEQSLIKGKYMDLWKQG